MSFEYAIERCFREMVGVITEGLLPDAHQHIQGLGRRETCGKEVSHFDILEPAASLQQSVDVEP